MSLLSSIIDHYLIEILQNAFISQNAENKERLIDEVIEIVDVIDNWIDEKVHELSHSHQRF